MPERHRIITVINEFQLWPERFIIKCTFLLHSLFVNFQFEFHLIFFVIPLKYSPISLMFRFICSCAYLLRNSFFHLFYSFFKRPWFYRILWPCIFRHLWIEKWSWKRFGKIFWRHFSHSWAWKLMDYLITNISPTGRTTKSGRTRHIYGYGVSLSLINLTQILW